jgi:hypothetical protein
MAAPARAAAVATMALAHRPIRHAACVISGKVDMHYKSGEKGGLSIRDDVD